MYYEAQWEQGRCQSLAYGHTMLLTLQISSPRNLSLYVAAVYTPSCTFMSMNVTLIQLLYTYPAAESSLCVSHYDAATVHTLSCRFMPMHVRLSCSCCKHIELQPHANACQIVMQLL